MGAAEHWIVEIVLTLYYAAILWHSRTVHARGAFNKFMFITEKASAMLTTYFVAVWTAYGLPCTGTFYALLWAIVGTVGLTTAYDWIAFSIDSASAADSLRWFRSLSREDAAHLAITTTFASIATTAFIVYELATQDSKPLKMQLFLLFAYVFFLGCAQRLTIKHLEQEDAKATTYYAKAPFWLRVFEVCSTEKMWTCVLVVLVPMMCDTGHLTLYFNVSWAFICQTTNHFGVIAIVRQKEGRKALSLGSDASMI